MLKPIRVSCLPRVFHLPSLSPCERVGVHVSDVCCQVNESDNTIVPVEIRKVEDAGEVVEDKAPIKHGVNGDVEGTTVAGSEGADLDLADQTLVGDLSHDADTPVVREVAVSRVLRLDLSLPFSRLFRVERATLCSVFPSAVLLFPRVFGVIEWGCILIPTFP